MRRVMRFRNIQLLIQAAANQPAFAIEEQAVGDL
jgi:hypothetical protein